MPNRTVVTCPACGQKNGIPWARLGAQGRCGKCKGDLPAAAEPIDVPPGGLDALVSQSPLPVLVDFWAPWCGPCRMVAPELMKVAARGAGRLVVAKVNTEADPRTGAAHGVRSIPTMAVFSGGREVARSAGARPAPQIEAFVDQALQGA